MNRPTMSIWRIASSAEEGPASISYTGANTIPTFSPEKVDELGVSCGQSASGNRTP
jgi:hypothetical protein